MRPSGMPANGKMPMSEYEKRTGVKPPRIVAWEITRSCNLACAHCRADAEYTQYQGELSKQQIFDVIDDICSMCSPLFILTGGEPLLRDDIWDIIDHINERGGKPVIGTNATLITDEIAQNMHDHGIGRISVSVDFPDARRHDEFRGQPGAFDATVRGIRRSIAHGVGVQVNTTVTKLNLDLLPQIHDLAVSLGAVAFHPFLLVPTGRGEGLRDVELTPQEYDDALLWAYETQKNSPLQFKPTDAPQYCRIMRQQAAREGVPFIPENFGHQAMSRGCLGGISFVFISHVGDLQPCGYFDKQVGNVKDRPFSRIWAESEVFQDLRDYSKLKGKCGACEYKGVCGGCRARALSATGDYLEEEPYCAYIPKKMRESHER